MTSISDGPGRDGGAAAAAGGRVICLHEYARLRSRTRGRGRDELHAVGAGMSDAERNVQALYARRAIRVRARDRR